MTAANTWPAVLLSLAAAAGQAQGLATPDATADNPSNGLLAISLAHPPPDPDNSVDQAYAHSHRWRGGRIVITLRNVTESEIASVISNFVDEDYLFDVFDSSGKPVPLTSSGQRARFAFYHPSNIVFSGGRVDLLPAEEHTISIDLTDHFQIHPGERYTVKVRRSRGLPKKHENGRIIDKVELSTTYIYTLGEDQ